MAIAEPSDTRLGEARRRIQGRLMIPHPPLEDTDMIVTLGQYFSASRTEINVPELAQFISHNHAMRMLETLGALATYFLAQQLDFRDAFDDTAPCVGADKTEEGGSNA